MVYDFIFHGDSPSFIDVFKMMGKAIKWTLTFAFLPLILAVKAIVWGFKQKKKFNPFSWFGSGAKKIAATNKGLASTADQIKKIQKAANKKSSPSYNEIWEVQNKALEKVGKTAKVALPKIKKIAEKKPELKYKNEVDGYMSWGDNFYDFFSVRVNPDTKKYESEDYGFCRLWKECGGEIHCATDTNLVHIGRYHYTGNLYKQLQFFER